MVEQAAFDRNLYQSSPGTKHVNLKFPEYVPTQKKEQQNETQCKFWLTDRIFNTGSPYNVSAGQGARNLHELVAHYEKQNAESEEKKTKATEEHHIWDR
jgi:hypothetical protein